MRKKPNVRVKSAQEVGGVDLNELKKFCDKSNLDLDALKAYCEKNQIPIADAIHFCRFPPELTKRRETPLGFSGAKPSEISDIFWIYAKREKGKYLQATPRGGKWLVFIPPADVDEVWAKIKLATEEGKLGDRAKVSTTRPNPNSGGSSAHVICVYTYDWTDEADVRRVRDQLRELGITNKIPYKSDEDTLSGKYRVTGHTRISKYYE